MARRAILTAAAMLCGHATVPGQALSAVSTNHGDRLGEPAATNAYGFRL